MSVTISRAAVAAVAERMRSLVPANISPFFTDALREAAAERVLRDLQCSGWELVSAAELAQLRGQARDASHAARKAREEAATANGMVKQAARTIRAVCEWARQVQTAHALGLPVDAQLLDQILTAGDETPGGR